MLLGVSGKYLEILLRISQGRVWYKGLNPRNGGIAIFLGIHYIFQKNPQLFFFWNLPPVTGIKPESTTKCQSSTFLNNEASNFILFF
jgi:hypothetical protein